MQCPSCQFENMPGLVRCARCQGLLVFSGVEIVPPRASGPALLRRRLMWSCRLRQYLHDCGHAIRHGAKRVFSLDQRINPLAALGSIVPGGGQLVLRQRKLGWGLLLGWGFLMLLSVVLIGSDEAKWFSALAVTIHAVAIALVIRGALRQQEWWFHLFVGIALVVVLQWCIYSPFRGLVANVAGAFPVHGLNLNAAVDGGDVLLVTGSWTRPDTFARGDLVVYRYQHGFGLDRIVGVTGDHVTLRGGVLRVNGYLVPPHRQPIGTVRALPDLEFTVGDNCVAILPSAMPMRVQGNVPHDRIVALVRHASEIPLHAIEGVVLWRVRPYSRFGTME